ncbi:S8 family peptidase [Inquilinus sp. CA228]|uniref:S8 family peptidase n=1 Tax=Inquilinus sp. CA228 TaxID=3455609 RepID=UPI003F8D4805
MTDLGDFDERHLAHLPIDLWRESVGYDYPSRKQQRRPLRDDYTAHAQGLIRQLTDALGDLPPRDADPRLPIPNMAPGTLISVETMPPREGGRVKAVKVPAGLEFQLQDIVVLRSMRNDDRTEGAVLFVPDNARDFLRRRIAAYGARNLGGAKRPDLERFEVIETIQAAAARSLFVGEIDFAGPASWWELWVRAPNMRANAIAAAARNRGFDVHGERLIFPDTVVVLVHGLPVEMLILATQTPGAIAEIRRATGTIRPFLERGDKVIGQSEFVTELATRVTPPPADAPAVSILDTGVAAAHPLIAPGIAGALAYDDAWGTDDHADNGGHGTGVIGLVLYGDLEGAMNDRREIALTHSAISIKLLPPPGFEANTPRHYGIITQGAVARIETDHHETTRIFCLACSTDEFSTARPSSWSGALDQIASGSSVGDAGDPPRPAMRRPKRLMVVAAGNANGGMRDAVLTMHAIEDPAQSWNSLTIGGYTAKETVAPEDAPMTALVGANELSPFSRSSEMLPDDLTPIKPEVLFEAGNMLIDDAGFCAWAPSVSLLTAGNDIEVEPLTPIWATSAATGMAGHFFGQLEAALPGLWPETYRGLAVQSAEWPSPIRKMLIGRGDHWRTGKSATKAVKQRILRSVGYGVPDIERAITSARNDVTMIAQAEIQPFASSQDGRTAVYNEMHFYDLPWPREALEQLENRVVTMKVTLSYFVEPNLTGRAATRPDTYRSFGLRFAMKRRSESDPQFRARVNAAQEADADGASDEASYWLLGPKAVSAGSLHCDLWRGRAIELALHDAIAVFPVGGWWKSHIGQRRMADRGRYSLLISISAPGQAVDLYTEIAARVEAKTAEIKLTLGL